MKTLPVTMHAMVIGRFGGAKELKKQTLPVPSLAPNEVLIQVKWAGLGEWDPFEREGGFVKMFKLKASFPYVLGSEGAGVVRAVGSRVRRFKAGDSVYASSFLNPKGGFYAEYAAVDQKLVAPIPKGMKLREAGVMSGVALTALRGLEDTLKLKRGETLLIFGASGALGHIAVQLAKHQGAKVFAIASGKAGVALAQRVGADATVDGHGKGILEAARRFAPKGFDAALLLASGGPVEEAIQALRKGGRVAYPNGPQDLPKPPRGVKMTAYDGKPDAEIIRRFARRANAHPISVHIAQTFPLARVAAAHRALEKHHVGKLALRVA